MVSNQKSEKVREQSIVSSKEPKDKLFGKQEKGEQFKFSSR